MGKVGFPVLGGKDGFPEKDFFANFENPELFLLNGLGNFFSVTNFWFLLLFVNPPLSYKFFLGFPDMVNFVFFFFFFFFFSFL